MSKAVCFSTLPKTIAGGWKFRANEEDWSTSIDQLAKLAKELVEQNPGGGRFIWVDIHATAKNELSISFVYEAGPDEKIVHEDDRWMRPYQDLFMRRAGAAYKGHSIGHTVVRVATEEGI